MKILSLGYNTEADELDLLIDTDFPVPAESIPIDEGIYIRVDKNSGKVMVDHTRDRAARLRSSDAQHLKSDGILDTKNRDVVAEQLRLF